MALQPFVGAGVAQSVKRLATGWTTEVGVRVKNFLQIVQTGSGVHPTSYPVGARGFFPGCKTAEAWSWPLTSS
jgi:hypothetical protein